MVIAAIVKGGEVAAKTVEKVGEVKELVLKEMSNGSEILQPDMEVIKSQSLESLMEVNIEKAETVVQIETPEFRPLTEEDAKTIQEITKISDATLKDCTINENGVVRLSCINESKLGEASEVPYVEKTINVNGVEIQVIVPELPDVLYEFIIPKELYLADDYELFKYCTEQLKSAIDNNPELAKQFSTQQLEQIMNGAPRISGLTWHHGAECGRMQLVPTKMHSDFRHTGGKAIWGGGRN